MSIPPATFGRYRSWKSYAPSPPVTTASRCLAAPAASEAATRHVVRGAGWGHGIGMSQYGAYGYALEGATYRAILSHYYSGTSLVTASQRSVRVLLQPEDPYIRVRGATRGGGRRLEPATTYIARPARRGASRSRTTRGKLVGRFSSGLRLGRPDGVLRLLGPALNGVSSGRYRGAIEIVPTERRPDRHQQPADRRLRARGGGRGDAELLAAGGAQGPGRGRAHLRAGHAQDRAASSTSTPTRARRCTEA